MEARMHEYSLAMADAVDAGDVRYDAAQMSQWRAIARVDQLAPGDVIGVEIDGVEIVVGRDGDHYFATQRRCVHRGGDLADGIISRGHVICPQHGWRFSTINGRNADAAEYCLVVYAVRVHGDHIEVDPIPRTLRGH
jgi:nitrite reductase (NADH) small subunit